MGAGPASSGAKVAGARQTAPLLVVLGIIGLRPVCGNMGCKIHNDVEFEWVTTPAPPIVVPVLPPPPSCPGDPRYVFTYSGEMKESHIIRCAQMAWGFRRAGVRAECIDEGNANNITNAAVVVVKTFSARALFDRLHNAGNVVGYDIIDGFAHTPVLLASPSVDFLIVASKVMEHDVVAMRSNTTRTDGSTAGVVVLEHHTVANEPMKHGASHDQATTLTSHPVDKHMVDYLKAHVRGLTWKDQSCTRVVYRSVAENPAMQDPLAQARFYLKLLNTKGFFNVVSCSKDYGLSRRWKSSQRIANAAAAGQIPIAEDCPSHSDVIREYNVPSFHDVESLAKVLKHLVKHHSLRARVRDNLARLVRDMSLSSRVHKLHEYVQGMAVERGAAWCSSA